MATADSWTLEQIRRHIDAGLKLASMFNMEVVEASAERSCVRLNPGGAVMRPGGIVAGPILFALADVAAYALVLASRHDAGAVTIDLTINFLRAATALPLIAEATPLRAGRRVFSADIRIVEVESGRLVSQATANYALSDGGGAP